MQFLLEPRAHHQHLFTCLISSAVLMTRLAFWLFLSISHCLSPLHSASCLLFDKCGACYLSVAVSFLLFFRCVSCRLCYFSCAVRERTPQHDYGSYQGLLGPHARPPQADRGQYLHALRTYVCRIFAARMCGCGCARRFMCDVACWFCESLFCEDKLKW